MGSKQFTFEMSSWSVTPRAALAVGGVLVVVMIMATTALCLVCYYWGLLLRKALRVQAAVPPLPQITPSDYKVFMTLEPPCTCLPTSTVVLMPGEETPTFLALPCHPSCIEVNLQGNNETKEEIASMRDVEIKVEVYN